MIGVHAMESIGAVSPLHIAVVGHTNAGKTSLLRTLTRRRSFGDVSDRPGATRQTEAVDLMLGGVVRIEYWDTPGLEDAVGLEDALLQLAPEAEPIDRLRTFLNSPLAQGDFEQEAKVIRAMLGELHAAMLVVDCREPVLPKYRSELRLLVACAKPVFPVLNHVAAQQTQTEAWLQVLRETGLHAHALFDAVAPFDGAEQTLYADLASLLPQHRAALQQVRDGLAAEARARTQRACQIAAASLIELARQSQVVALDDLKDPVRKQQLIDDFRQQVLARLHAPQTRMLDLYGFQPDDVRMADLQQLAGDWADDLFDPELLKQVGLRLGKGAVIGGAVGLVADVALAGLSLGTGTTVGAAVGGIFSRGWQPALEILRQRVQGQHALRLEDAALLVLAQRWVDFIRTLNGRGHASMQREVVGEGDVLVNLPPAVAGSLLRPLREASVLMPEDDTTHLITPLSVALQTALELPVTRRLP